MNITPDMLDYEDEAEGALVKGFDDHLDNYGDPDPGDDSLYPECEHTHKIGGREFTHSHEGGGTPHSAVTHPDLDALISNPNDEPPFDENHYRFHTPTGPNPACVNCRWLTWDQPREETG